MYVVNMCLIIVFSSTDRVHKQRVVYIAIATAY